MSTSSAADDAAPWQLAIRFANRRDELPRVVSALEAFAAEHDLSERDRFVLHLVVDELATNVIDYAYPDGGEHAIDLRARVRARRLDIELENGGIAFDPLALPGPLLDAPLEEREIGGLGIHLVRQTVERMQYRRQGDRNCVSIVCRIHPGRADPESSTGP